MELRLTINPFQHENQFAKKNTTTQVGKKVATSGEQVERVGETARNYHVKSIISPGVKIGLSSFFNFFLGRSSSLSFKCLPFLILSTSAWYLSASAWHLWTSAWQ